MNKVKLPKKIKSIRKINGFIVETHTGIKIIALHEEDLAFIEVNGTRYLRDSIIKNDNARDLYNDMYDRFPK